LRLSNGRESEADGPGCSSYNAAIWSAGSDDFLKRAVYMSLLQSQGYFSVEEYLALEWESEERHEYLDGHVHAMAGESPEHSDICANLAGILHPQLRGTPCRVWSKDTKVRSGPEPRSCQATKGLFSYPDLVVVCGAPQFHDAYRDVLLNPTVIIEVLSPSTEAFDRGEKFWRYRTWLPALTNYLLVSQALPLIEHYLRQANDTWNLSTVSTMEGSVYLATIDCTLRLREVYDRINFPSEMSEPPDEV
jgi:Uma2 family endonuclease